MSYYFNGSTAAGENRFRLDATFSALGSPPTSSAFTMAIWIKPDDATPAAAMCPISIGTTGSTSDLVAQLALETNGTSTVETDLNTTVGVTTTNAVQDAVQGSWHLIVGSITVDGTSFVSRRKVFTYNGVGTDSAEADVTPSQDLATFTRLHIGERIANNGEFAGYAAHAAIWTKELDAGELTDLCSMTPDQVATANLAYYWPLLTNADAHASYGGSGFNLGTPGVGVSLNSGDGPTLSSGSSSIAPLAAYYRMLNG